jgi:hypothetical protein
MNDQVVLNQAGAMEPCSTPHQQGRRYKRAKPTYLKDTMTLAFRRVTAYIYYNPLIHFHNKTLTKRKSISSSELKETNPNILTNWE